MHDSTGDRVGGVPTYPEREQSLKQLPPGEAAFVVEAYKALELVKHVSSWLPTHLLQPTLGGVASRGACARRSAATHVRKIAEHDFGAVLVSATFGPDLG